MITTTPKASSRPTTTQQLLASLHNDRAAALRSLANQPFRITGDPIDAASFWNVFDESVRADGTVDTSALVGRADGDVVHLEPVEIFIVVCGLLLTAFSVGYGVGKDAADTDDADDEAAGGDDDAEADHEGGDDAGGAGGDGAGGDGAGDQRVGHHKTERATMVFAPGRRGIATQVVTTKLAQRSGDVPAQTLLANLRNDRPATLKRLRERRNWRVVVPPMTTQGVWAFIDTSVSADGTINLATTHGPTSLLAPAEPAAFTGIEEMLLIALATLAAGALGFEVGYRVNDNEPPGSTDDEAETEGSEGSGGQDESGGTGGGNDDSGGDTGDDGGAGAGVVATPILRNGSLGTVDITFRDATVNDVV
jgi:hypothetical protein